MSQDSSSKETESYERELRQRWIEVLAEVWRAADWRTITGQRRRATDVFQHRLRVASTQQRVPKAIRKLCHGLSLQAPEMPTEALDALVSDEEAAMRMIRDEDVYLTLKAKETVQSYFDQKNGEGSEGPDRNIRTSELSDFVEV